MWIFLRILKLPVQIASIFSVKYFCSQQTIVEEEIQEVELRFVVRNLQARSCTWQTGTQQEKRKGIFMEGYPEKYHSLLFLRILN